MIALLVLAVFVSAVVIDYAEAHYVRAVGRGDAHRAAVWSLAMYATGALGFVAVVDVSLWLMIPEGLGFYVGTRLALRDPLRAVTTMACSLHGSRSSDRSR